MFKEIFTEINEGTTATITVKDGDLYKTSFLQYDGYNSKMKPELKKYWNSPKLAVKLTTKSGELISVDSGEVEYYTDKKKLYVTKDIEEAQESASKAYYRYYFDGENWFWSNGELQFKNYKKV